MFAYKLSKVAKIELPILRQLSSEKPLRWLFEIAYFLMAEKGWRLKIVDLPFLRACFESLRTP